MRSGGIPRERQGLGNRAELLLHVERTGTSLGMVGWESTGESGALAREVRWVGTPSCCSWDLGGLSKAPFTRLW